MFLEFRYQFCESGRNPKAAAMTEWAGNRQRKQGDPQAPKLGVRVICIRRGNPISETDELVADLAYTLWRSSPFRCGTPEEALFAAARMVKGTSAAGPFLVPKHKLHAIIVMKRSS